MTSDGGKPPPRSVSRRAAVSSRRGSHRRPGDRKAKGSKDGPQESHHSGGTASAMVVS